MPPAAGAAIGGALDAALDAASKFGGPFLVEFGALVLSTLLFRAVMGWIDGKAHEKVGLGGMGGDGWQLWLAAQHAGSLCGIRPFALQACCGADESHMARWLLPATLVACRHVLCPLQRAAR